MVSAVAKGIHPVKLRGLQAVRLRMTGEEPTILERTDADPIAGVLADLLKPELSAIAQTLIKPTARTGPRYQLYQPVHRVFHLVLLEAVCDQFGTTEAALQPRLDPLKIESAGLVLRRTESGKTKGWRTLAAASAAATRLTGWVTIPPASLEQDPGLQAVQNALPQIANKAADKTRKFPIRQSTL